MFWTSIANAPGSSLYGTSVNLFTGTGADTVNVLGMVTGNVINIEGQSGLNWPRWQRLATAAEDLGFAAIYRSDHIVNPQQPDEDSPSVPAGQ